MARHAKPCSDLPTFVSGDIGWSVGSITPFKVAQNLKGHWTNLTVFWKLANNVLYAKIRRLFNIKKLFEWTKILFSNI